MHGETVKFMSTGCLAESETRMATDDSVPRVSGKCGTAGRRVDMAQYVVALRCNRKVAGSIPNRIIEIFRLNDPFCGPHSLNV